MRSSLRASFSSIHIGSRRSRGRAPAVGLALLAILVAACGGSSESKKESTASASAPDVSCNAWWWNNYGLCLYEPALAPASSTSTSITLNYFPYSLAPERPLPTTIDVMRGGSHIGNAAPQGSQYVDRPLASSTTYFYRLCSVYTTAYGDARFCSDVGARTQPAAPPPPPPNPPPPTPPPPPTVPPPANAMIVSGDFNGDGKADVALVGGAGWVSVPVAFSRGDGAFDVANYTISGFATFATQPGARAVTGDFNGDGKTDIALVGGQGWSSVPVAFSRGNGVFDVANYGSTDFAAYAQQGAHAVVGDFDRDGKSDIALVGGRGWSTFPVAFSRGDGIFEVENNIQGLDFDRWAEQPGVVPILSGGGTRNGNWNSIALVGGGVSWGYPLIYARTSGQLQLNQESPQSFGDFLTWTGQPGARPVSGDFDGDGVLDIGLVGGAGWTTLPVAFCAQKWATRIDHVANAQNPDSSLFSTFARQGGAQVVTGDFDNDGKWDIALAGGTGWSTLPVAFSQGDGTFRVSNAGIDANFAKWTQGASQRGR